jgi:peroxiredoxin
MSELSTEKRLDDLLKVAIMIAAMLVGYLLGRNSAATSVAGGAPPAPAHTAMAPQTDLVGQPVSLPGVDWARNQRTLVFALQTGCHFCTDSGPFYRRLITERNRFGDTKLVAVLPQDVEASKEFLERLGVSVDIVAQSSLSRMGVLGTPTPLLVNSDGIVTEAWTGRLPPSAEDEVLARLRVH